MLNHKNKSNIASASDRRSEVGLTSYCDHSLSVLLLVSNLFIYLEKKKNKKKTKVSLFLLIIKGASPTLVIVKVVYRNANFI
jgi:hypothetical protein